jgi:hypothetical protein
MLTETARFMPNDLESTNSIPPDGEEERAAGWMRVGLVAAASALAGGMAAAWYYRKTLTRLRQAEELEAHSDSMEPPDDFADGI